MPDPKSKIPLVDLHVQYLSIKPEIDAAIARVIEHSAFIGGEALRLFEQEFAIYCEAVVSLPLYGELTDAQVVQVIGTMHGF